MTMADDKCDVCLTNKPIGVASTLMPYSCAYCAECARRHAQPALVFECWFEDVGTNYGKMMENLPDFALTYADGQYITYRQWADAKMSGAFQK